MIFWILWLFFSKRGYEKKILRQISNSVFRAPWLWGIKKTGKLYIFILLNIFNSYNMDTKDTLICNYKILEKISPSY